MAQPRIRTSVTLLADQARAVRRQAEREGHGNVSLIIQRALDKELEIERDVPDDDDDAADDAVVELTA